MVSGQNIAIQKQATITVTARNRGLAIPANVRVQLLNTGDSSTYGPTSLSAAATDPTASFTVRAGSYRARTTTLDTTYPQQVSSPDQDVAIGAVGVPFDITLPRVSRFSVTGPPTATVTIPTLTPKSEPSGTTIEFVETTTSGTLSATVSATGYRNKVVTVPAQLLSNNAVTLLPTVTVTGTITGASNGPITAVNAANAGDTRPGTITGGSYSIPGLDNNADGTAKTWNISYSQTGVGAGAATPVVVSDSSSASETRNIALTPRPVNYNFTVTTGASTAVPSATVTITPPVTVAPTDANGKTTAVVNENVPFDWAVRKTGFLTRYGSFPTATSVANVPVLVTLDAGVSGTATGTGLAGTVVEVCPSGATAACAPGAARTFATTGNATSRNFTITSDLLPGPYTVVAYAGTRTGTTTLTIAANGTATLSPTNIAIPDPPPGP